jgi:curved DNA-binding protein CbpA
MTQDTASYQPNTPSVNAAFRAKTLSQGNGNLGKYNYYQVLELPNFASVEQVKLAYRELAKRWHPDFHLENLALAQEAEERFKAINMAYVTLKSVETKALYDDKLRLLLEKIAAYMAKNNPAYMVPTPPQQYTQTTNPAYNPTPSVPLNQESNVTPPPINTPKINTDKTEQTTSHQNEVAYSTDTDVQQSKPVQQTTIKANKSYTAASQYQQRGNRPDNSSTSSATPQENKEGLFQTQEVLSSPASVASEPTITIRKEKLPPPIPPKKTDETELESSMPHYDFLTRLRYCLRPNKPVTLFTKEPTEVEGVLNLSAKQAKAGKAIRLQLDASHCEKFNLPTILQLQLPKNLQEGQRLKITEEAWQQEDPSSPKGGLKKVKSLGKKTTKPTIPNNQSLVLVVHIQEDQSLFSKMLALGGLIKPASQSKQPLFPSSAPAIDTPPAMPWSDTQTLIDPIIIAEQITIPLPLAILGGIYAFTTSTSETLQVPIPSGIPSQTVLNIGGKNNTLFEVEVNWYLPDASALSADEKRLYETLMLISLTEEERIKSALEATENEQTAEAE